MKLSVTCIGHRELYHLKELLPELMTWADEVIYVDCESQDGSFEYAQSLGLRCFQRENNMNLNVNKSFAMEQAQGEWIFYVDPDERFSEALVTEVLEKIQSDKAVAYRLPRRNHFFGHWLKYGGQYPDMQLRLFQRGKGRFPNQHVHETLKIDGPIGQFSQAMDHYPYLTISQFLKKMDFYSSFEARHLLEKGVRPSLVNHFKFLFFKPLSRFFRRGFVKGGFRDGLPGLFAAFFDGVGWSLRYFKLWELRESRNPLGLETTLYRQTKVKQSQSLEKDSNL